MERDDRANYIIRVLRTIPLYTTQKTGIWEELILLLQLISAVEQTEDSLLKTSLKTLVSQDWGRNFSASHTMVPFYNLYLEAADYYINKPDLQATFSHLTLFNEFSITNEESEKLSKAMTLICEWQQGPITEDRLKTSIRDFLNNNSAQERLPTDLSKAIDTHYQRAFRRLKEVIKNQTLWIDTTMATRIDLLKLREHFPSRVLKGAARKIENTLGLKQSFFSSPSTLTSDYMDFSRTLKAQTDIALLSKKIDTIQILDQAGIDTTESFFWVDFSQQLMDIKQTCNTILFHLSQQGNQESHHLRFTNISNALLTIETLRNDTMNFLLRKHPSLEHHHHSLTTIEHQDKLSDNDLIDSITHIEAICQTTAGIALLTLDQGHYPNVVATQAKYHPIAITTLSDQLRQLSLAAFQRIDLKSLNLTPASEHFNHLYSHCLTLFLGSRIIDLSMHEGMLNRWAKIARHCLDSQDYSSFDAITQAIKYFYGSLDKHTYYSKTPTENIQTILSISLGIEERVSQHNQIVILDTRNISKGLERAKEIGGKEKLLKLLDKAYEAAKTAQNEFQETAWQHQINTSSLNQTLLHNGCISRIQHKPRKMTLLTRILDAEAKEIDTLNKTALFLKELDNAQLTNHLWLHEDIDTIVTELSTMNVARAIQGYLENKGINIDEETADEIASKALQSRGRRDSLALLASQFQEPKNPPLPILPKSLRK